MKRLLLCCTAAIAQWVAVGAEFYNLDFDQANTNHLSDAPGHADEKMGTATDLLPGWNLLYDGHPYSGPIFYPQALVTLPTINHIPFAVDYVHDFYFTFEADIFFGVEHAWSMSQVGRIPSSAWDLLTFGFGRMYVNGIEIPPMIRPGFNQRAYDIHEFAGQEVKLEFRNDSRTPGGYGGIELDILGFATPEPSQWALLAVGGAIAAWAVWRKTAR